MKIAYNLQSSNPEKHHAMPGGYPWLVYEIDDGRQEEFESLGYTVASNTDFETYRDSIDLAGYYAALQAEAPFVAITARQIRLALVAIAGLTLADISAALASLPEPEKTLAEIEWEYSTVFERENPLVNSVALLLGWTTEQVDQLWRAAAQL